MKADNKYHDEYVMIQTIQINQQKAELDELKKRNELLKKRNELLENVIHKVRFSRKEANKIVKSHYKDYTWKQIKKFNNWYIKRLLKTIIGNEYPFLNFKNK